MTDLRQAAQAALEALEAILMTRQAAGSVLAVSLAERVNNLRAALAAEPAQPVAWMSMRFGNSPAQSTISSAVAQSWRDAGGDVRELYTAPPQRQPLTDEQITALKMVFHHFGDDQRVQCLRPLAEHLPDEAECGVVPARGGGLT